MRSIMIVLSTMLLSAALNVENSASSYIKLKGQRLTRFQKTKGKSEFRRLVSLTIPASRLVEKKLVPLDTRGRYPSFEHKGILYYVERTNPYFIQAKRKAKKNKRGRLLIKGKVMRIKVRAKKWRFAVKVHTMQKFGKAKKRRGVSKKR